MVFSLNKTKHFSMQYDERFVLLKLTNYLREIVPENNSTYVVTCIGTDRSTGDSLGPLTGSLLSMRHLENLHVYGTLHDPLHALNLQQCIDMINKKYRNPFIIAIDAALGTVSSIGTIHCGNGPLKPGSALKKELPEIGHAHICATVNINSELNYLVLQNTRLSLVYDMAYILSQALYRLDLSLRKTSDKSIVL